MTGSQLTLRRSLLLVVALVAGLGGRALGQVRDDAETERANAGTVGVVSGGLNGSYLRIAADLAAVLDDGDALRVLPIIGKGSLQNVHDVLFLRGVDVGIVQSDVLAYIKRQQMYPGIESALQYIAKLYDEEVHVLARRDINRLEDLRDQPVNVDLRGSGTALTAHLLFGSLDIPVKERNQDQADALEQLKRGDVAALVYVTGKPADLFARVPPEAGLHFLPVELTPALLESYLPARIEHSDYPGLVPDDQPVDTVAVGTVMAVYGWKPGTDRFRKVAQFVEAFFAHFDDFMRAPRHPKWRDVSLSAQVPGWTRFAPAARMARRLSNTAAAATRQRFADFVSQSAGSANGLSEKQQDDLFQAFMSWQAHQESGILPQHAGMPGGGK